MAFDDQKFQDFFRFYDHHNPRHQNAVLELAKHIPAEQLADEANWVRIFRTAPPTPELEQRKPPTESVRLPYEPGRIDWHDNNFRVSRHFTVGEVTRFDPRRIPPIGSAVERAVLALATDLDKLREDWNRPIGVTSWNRPPAINQAVGGVSNSQHILGSAVDLYDLGGNDRQFEDFLDRHWGGALGYGIRSGRGFTHLDMRGGGFKRGSGSIRWNY
ncbi:hypothetical protein GS597_09105 [Synechococcales cyanobacterium C]|uniref:Peptidase M15A C-terminal domain-containing protein n=1 Tax=Petrachloros mirabilis ULC683 TaxID=2781853 RepID=A0A8K1ZWR4_9CYAN|nr:D-Ala-D-Ala carboxypeptidase family metallohydrolase [Petrachloros mirabilis]NCJ06660.1 hypothetical protein [Petrachloros mirabilis ULC683]